MGWPMLRLIMVASAARILALARFGILPGSFDYIRHLDLDLRPIDQLLMRFGQLGLTALALPEIASQEEIGDQEEEIEVIF